MIFKPSSLRADADRVQLSWNAPADCPDRAHANAELRRLLEDSSAPQSTAVRVEVASHASGFAAEITFSGALQGERRLGAANCRALVDAAMLIVAITVDPLAVAQLVAAAREETEDKPARQRRAPVRPSLGVSLRGDWATLPEVTFGAGAHIALAIAPWQVQLEGTWWLPQIEQRNWPGGEIRLTDGALRGCYDILSRRSLALAPCAAFAFGMSSGSALRAERDERVVRSDKSYSAWLGTLVGLRVRQRSREFYADFAADLGFAFMRPSFEVRDTTMDEPSSIPIFRPSLLFGRLSIGVGWML